MIAERLSRPVRPLIGALTIAIVVLILADGWVWLDRGANGYYEFAPGTAPTITDSATCRAGSSGGDPSLPGGTPCVRIGVPARLGHGLNGSLFMVDVLVGPAPPFDYLLHKMGLLNFFHDGAQLIPRGAVLGDTPQSQLGCQDLQQMQGSTSSAAVVALRRLGYTVKENDLGAQLYQVQPGTPAATAGLQCGDVITDIEGSPVHTAADVVTIVHRLHPGQTVTVTAQRTQGDKTTTVRLKPRLTTTPAEGNQPASPTRAFLGVVTQTRLTYTFPFDVTIDVGTIGGPSAGLALTLGILDVLSDGQLTGGKRVAATGTIALDGTVGAVGGVAQKTVAVRRAGAQVFFVPADELSATRGQAGGMKVYPVTTLEQALSDLAALGGTVPPKPTTSGLRASG